MIPRYKREYFASDLLNFLRKKAHPRVGKLFPRSDVHLVHSGREALFLILSALGLPKLARVGVPLYCCSAVFEATVAAGCVPVFLDLDPASYGIATGSLSDKGLDAVVVVHTFGYPVDVDAIRIEVKVPIIEDCAHSLFSSFKGALTGTLSEASFFSFGVHKPASVGSGGMIVVNEHSLKAKVAAALESLPTSNFSISHSLKCYVRSLAYTQSIYGLAIRLPVRKGFGEAGNVSEWRPRKMREADKACLDLRIKDFQELLPDLARNYSALRSRFRTLHEPDQGSWNNFLFPAIFPDQQTRDAEIRDLSLKGIDAGVLYPSCIHHARRFGYTSGCPNAEQAVGNTCIIPNYTETIWRT